MDAASRGFAIALCATLALLGFGTCSLAAPQIADEASRLGVASLGLELFLASIALAGGALSATPLRQRLGLCPGRLGAPALLALAIGTLAVSHGMDSVAEVSGLREQSTLADFDAVIASASGAGLWLVLLGLGVAPGIAEELLCRGLVQRGLEPRLGPAAAVVVAALFFGALHLDPVHAALAGVLGLYLGAMAVLAGSIRPAILCHALNNLVAVGFTALLPERLEPGPIGILIGLPLGGLCLWAAFRSRGRPAAPPPGLQPEAESDDL